ncbi:MAG: YgeY family selenium metabolism-linked hydrolase [Roseiflexaceae bacterium]|nr:YgeY family selenium metabolism-linked hydrolase [Roseiflexaceae bacterium]
MHTQTQHDQVIDLCCELVRAKSMAGQEAKAAAVAERWMRQLGYDEVFVDEYGSVVGRIHGGGDGPRLHFDGHLDNVPATALEQWTHDPFAADLVDNTIWGRGATDMKGPLAAMICAAAFAPREKLRGTLSVSASVAEEELEGPALSAILRRHPADMVIIGESTLLQAGVGQKGRAGIRVTTHGRPAHSSVPHMGDNAVYRMVEAIQRLRALAPPEDALLGLGILELVEIVSSPYPGTSIIPDRCTVRWDRRLIRGETREGVLAGIRAALSGLDRVDVEYLHVAVPCYTGATLRSDDFHPAWDVPETSELVVAALHGIAAAGLTPRTCPIPYCTNGSGSAGDLGIPSVVIGPGDPAQFHVIDEYISVEQLTSGVKVYLGMIQHFQ